MNPIGWIKDVRTGLNEAVDALLERSEVHMALMAAGRRDVTRSVAADVRDLLEENARLERELGLEVGRRLRRESRP